MKAKRDACRVSNSRPQTQTSTQDIFKLVILERRPVFFRVRSIALLHTAHGTQCAQTWMMMYPKPKPVLVQGTQSCGKPCHFQRDTHEQKTPTFHKIVTRYK